MTVQEALWRAQGCPPHDVDGAPVDGQCALTGAWGPTWPARAVVSDLYTDWDRLSVAPDVARFGAAAIHSLRGGRHLRARPHMITAAPAVVELGPVDLGEVLAAPLGPGMCVTVPVSRQIHVIPYARWGMVCTDRDQVAWTVDDVARLGAYRRLRALGFGEGAQAETQPPYALLRKVRADVVEVMELWRELDAWRARPSLMDVAARATRTPKEDRGDDDGRAA